MNNNKSIEYKDYVFCDLKNAVIDNKSGVLYDVYIKHKNLKQQLILTYQETIFYDNVDCDTVTAKQLFNYYLDVLNQQW